MNLQPRNNERNNPLNIKGDPKDPWRGSTGIDDKGHFVFADPADGIRAAVRSIQQKYNNGKHTVRAIIRDWAPVSDTIGSEEGAPANDPDGYAKTVAIWMRIDPDEDLGLFAIGGPDVTDTWFPGIWIGKLVALVAAMSIFENGHKAPLLPMHKVYSGLAKFQADFIDNAKGEVK